MFNIDLLDKQIYSWDERLAAVDAEVKRLSKYLSNSTLQIQVNGEDIRDEFINSVKNIDKAVDLEKLSFTESLVNMLSVSRRQVLVGMKNYALGVDLIDENEDVIDSSKTLEEAVEESCKNSEENMNRLKSVILETKV